MDFFQRLGNWFGGKGWINDEEKRRKEQQSTPVAPQAPQSTKAVQFNQPKPLQQPSLLQNRQGFERQLQPKPPQTASQVANTTAMETQRHPRLQWDVPKPVVQQPSIVEQAKKELATPIKDVGGYWNDDAQRLRGELARGDRMDRGQAAGLLQSVRNRRSEIDQQNKTAEGIRQRALSNPYNTRTPEKVDADIRNWRRTDILAKTKGAYDIDRVEQQDAVRKQRLDPLFQQGKSFEDMAKIAGFSTSEIRQYADKFHRGYGDKGFWGNLGGGVVAMGRNVVEAPINVVGKVVNTTGDIINGDRVKNELTTINRAMQQGKITPARALELASELGGSRIAKRAYYDEKDGWVKLRDANALEFSGEVLDDGAAAASVLPMTGGTLRGLSALTKAAGATKAAGVLVKASTIANPYKLTAAGTRTASALRGVGMSKDTASMLGSAISTNARQSAVTGTAQTLADVANGRGISPESLAMNYGADFAMGVAPEVGLGVLGKGVTRLRNGQQIRNAYRVVDGDRPTAKITPSDDLPVLYTKDAHQRLLGKHPEEANRQFINDMGHLKALQRPDEVIRKSPRDVQYVKDGVVRDNMGRVSIKPLEQDGMSYINTAHLVGGRHRKNAVLSAGSADPASLPAAARGDGAEVELSVLDDSATLAQGRNDVNTAQTGGEIKKAQAELGTSPEPRNPEGIGTSSGLGNSAEAQGPRTSTVAKTGENVNIDTPKVGETPRLTEHAQDVRGFYFEEYKDKGADAMRRDLIESIWSENKKGQGVDFIQTPGEYYGGKRVSNNNPFYAGFYEEYGRKPTKQEITAIVDDALGVENELGRIVLPRDAMEYITENYFGDVDGLRAAREQIAAYGQQVAKESQAQGRQSAELARDVSPEEVNMYIDDQLKAQAHAQKPSMRDRLRGLKQRVRHFLVDDAVAYEDYMQRGDMSKQEFERQKMEHRENIDRVRSSDMIAEQFIRDNGLSELGKMSDHEADEFQQYLIAKRHVEDLAGRGIATGRDYAIDKAIVERFAEKYTAQEKAFRDFNHKLLDYMVDNNLITAENRDILVANNPNYAPFKRLMEDTERFTGNSKELANLRNESVIRKIKGSEKTVLNPVESLMENTLRVVNEAERNQAAMRIAQGVFPESRLTDGVQPRPGYDTVNFLENGQQVRYEVPEMVAREMKNLNNAMPDAAQFIVKVLSMPTKTLRAGATGANPLFAISNLVRDQGQVALTGDLGTMRRGTWPALQALFSPTEKGRALRAELRRNGIIGSEYRQTYGYKHGELVKELQKEYGLKHPIIKTVDKLKHPIDTISDIIGVTEYFTRAQQYFGTEGDAVMKAQAARNNTLNFSRAGASVRILNKIIPFLNAGVQGGRITYNTFRKRPVRTTVATAAVLGVAAAVKGINSSDEQRKEVWDRIADSDKKTNLIVLAPDARYNPESGRVEGVVKIPMPQMLYPVLDAVNNTQGKPEDFLRLGGNIFTMFSGIDTENPVNQLTPTAVKPFIEAALNRNSFTNKELVREYDKNKAPEDKGAMFTSGFARDMARLTGADAPVIDNFIQNWFGGLGKDAAKVMTDNPDNKRDGGGVGRYLNEGVGRRFLSATAKSEAMIGDEQATVIKERIRRSAEFQRLSPDQQAKILNKVDADFAAIAKTKVQVAKGEETKGINNRQQSLESGDLDISEYADDALLTREERSGARKKHLREVHHAEYDEFKKKYDKNVTSGAYTRMEALQAERKLQKLAAGKDIPKEVRDAYAGNKSDVWAMLNQIENEGERAKAAKEILDYGDKLVAAGVEKKNKFRDKYGNIAFAPHEGGSGGGRRGGGRGRSDGATVAARSNEASKVANAAAITLSSVARNRPQLRSVQFNGRAADLRQFMRGRSAGKPRKSRAVTFY